MDNFLEKYSPPKLNQEIDNLNRLTTRSEKESAIKKNFLQTKVQVQMASQENSTKHTKNLYPFFWNSSETLPKDWRKNTHKDIIYEANTTQIPKPDKDNTKKNYRPISLMTTDAKILNEILTNQIQEHIRRSHTTTKMNSSQGHKDCWTYANQSMSYTISTKAKTKTTWSSQQMQKKHLIKLNIYSW